MSSPDLRTRELTHALTSGSAKLWAILVGVDTYQDEEIADLQYSSADCRDLADVLIAATHQFPRKQIEPYHDLGVQIPTREAVLASFKQVVEQAKPQDTILFYFSGHGIVEPASGQAVLGLSDTQSDRLLDTGLLMQELLRWLEQCEARQQLIWLDACHSGELMLSGARDVNARSIDASSAAETTTALVRLLQQQTTRNRGLYALLSCDQGQRSWEFPELGHGLFTYYLIQGLQGAAADPVGVITADGLYQYLYKQTTQYIAQKNQAIRRLNQQRQQAGEILLHPEYPPQTPKRIVDGVGDLIVGLQRTSAQEPPDLPLPQPNLPRNLPRNLPGNTPRSAINRLLLGGAIALGIGGLYLGMRALSLRSTPPNPTSTDPTETSAACNLQIEVIEPVSKQMLEPQMLLSDCSKRQLWQPVKVRALQEGNPVWSLNFDKDNSLLVSAGGNVAEIWDLSKYQQAYVLGGHTGWVYSTAISPDAKRVATGSADQTARIWNVATKTLEHAVTGHRGAIWSVQFSPNGETIATASEDKTVKLWDVTTGALRYTFTGHQERVFTVAFNPQSGAIASAGGDRTIKFWQPDGTELRTVSGHQDTVRAIAFSQDGSRLASASWDRTVKIWDSQTGQLLNTFNQHDGGVLSVAFSPDGKTLASGSREDHTIKLWNVEDGTLIGTLYGQTDWVLSLAFSSDGKTLASGSKDQTVFLWQK